MGDQVWKVSEDKPLVAADSDLFTQGIDYLPAELSDNHWNKVEIHGSDADDLERLAKVIVTALNGREDILNG